MAKVKPIIYDGNKHRVTTTSDTILFDSDILINGNKPLTDGTVGLNSTTLPFLKDFNSFDTKSGFYYALGAGSSSPTANCPPLSGNTKLTVTVRNTGNVVHYEVIENTPRGAVKWLGEYFGDASTAKTVWTKVFTQYDTLSSTNLQESNPTVTYYVKLATFTNSTINNCNLQLLVSGVGHYDGSYFGSEIVDISSKRTGLSIRVTKLTENNHGLTYTGYGYVRNSDGSYDIYIKCPAYSNSTKVTILNDYSTTNLKLVENRVAITTEPTGFVENTNISTIITTDNIDMYGSGSNNLIGLKSFTSSSTYTPNPKATKLKVTLIGAGSSGYYGSSSGSGNDSCYGVDGDCLISLIDNPTDDVTIIIGAAQGWTSSNGTVRTGSATSFGTLLATNAISCGEWNTTVYPEKKYIKTPAIKSGDTLFHINSPLFNVKDNAFSPVFRSAYGNAGYGRTNGKSGLIIIEELA